MILPPPPDRGVSEDGSVGFDCRHDGRRALVTFASDGDVEILITKTPEGAANTQGESASAAPLLSLAGRGSGEPADSSAAPSDEDVAQTIARLRVTLDNALLLLQYEREESARLRSMVDQVRVYAVGLGALQAPDAVARQISASLLDIVGKPEGS